MVGELLLRNNFENVSLKNQTIAMAMAMAHPTSQGHDASAQKLDEESIDKAEFGLDAN